MIIENKYLSCTGNPCSELMRGNTDFLLARTSYDRITWISPFATKEEIKEIIGQGNPIDINKDEDYHQLMGALK